MLTIMCVNLLPCAQWVASWFPTYHHGQLVVALAVGHNACLGFSMLSNGVWESIAWSLAQRNYIVPEEPGYSTSRPEDISRLYHARLG